MSLNSQKQKWEDAVVRAAAEASRIEPLATALFIGALLVLAGNGVVEPIAERMSDGGFTGYDTVAEILRNLLETAPAVALVWGLGETRAYLRKLAAGELWGPATMELTGRVGDALLAAAVLATFVAPTLETWIDGGFGFYPRWDVAYIALGGLGLVLTLSARIVRNVVEVAAALKAENDEIV